MSRGLGRVVLRGRMGVCAGVSVVCAFAVLAGAALIPASAAAMSLGSEIRAVAALPSAASGCFTDDTQSDFEAGTANGCDLTSDPGSVQLSNAPFVDQSNSNLGTSGVGITTTTWGGQTFTPDKTGQLTQVDVNLFCSGCTGTTPDLTLSIRATSGGLPTGADLASATITGFNDGAAVYYTATFASPITVTGGTQYAFVVRPNANPSPGTYALTRSGTATAGSDVYPGGTRVAGATSGTVWSIPLTGGVSTDAGFNIWLNTGFVSSGTFISSVKNANPPAGTTPTWTTLSFATTTPANTAVAFQVAASNSPTGPFTFVGPDGTANTFFTTSGADLSQFDGFQYLEYEAFLSTTDSTATPSIQSVQVCFDDIVPTSLTVAPATGTEGGTADLSATLTSGANGLSGKTIAFTLGGVGVGSAVTGVDGTATLTNVALTGISPGTHPGEVAASFAGDTDDGPSSGASTLTVFGVPSVSSTVDDTATGSGWAGTEVTGATAFDTATVTGTSGAPTGTLTYTLYDNPSCSSPSAAAQTVNLSGGLVPPSSVTAALAAGSYGYQVSYSGDGTYAMQSGGCEPFTVGPAAPIVASVVDDPSTGLPWTDTEVTGASARDSSMVTGTGLTPTGTVTYSLYSNGTCAGPPIRSDLETVNNNGSVPDSPPTGALSAGSSSYQATYSGDGNYVPQTGSCDAFSIARATPIVTSVIDDASTSSAWAGTEVTGATAQDTSTITGVSGFMPTGSMTYALYGNPSCTGAPATSGQVAVGTDGTVPASSATAALGAGSYSYQAAYSGDGNYNATAAMCEPFTVGASSSSGPGGGSSPGPTGSGPPVPFRVFGITELRNGIVRFRVTAPAAGILNVLETAWDNDLARVAAATLLNPAPHRFTFARTHVRLSGSRTILVTVKPNPEGRRLLAYHSYAVHIRLWVTYAVPGHRQSKKGYYGIPLTP